MHTNTEDTDCLECKCEFYRVLIWGLGLIVPAGKVDEGGVHTNTEDTDCLECKCEFYRVLIWGLGLIVPAGEVDEGGVHTNTEDIDCLECKCDLWMSAIISRQSPGQAACPEHAAKLPCRPEDWILLHRCECSKTLGFRA